MEESGDNQVSQGDNEEKITMSTTDADESLESDAQIEPVQDTANQKVKKRIIDNDSEDEDNSKMQVNEDRILDEENEQLMMPALEDSEDENKSTKKKVFQLIDTDSEPDEELPDTTETSIAPIYTVNDKKEIVPERNISSGLAALCDPDSSDEENKSIEPLAYKKKSKKKGEENEEKPMSAKVAAEQRKEIESVSQRMLREKHIALPYHKPKQRTLKEFLQNRPRLTTTVPDAISKASAAVAIKMSKEQLDIVSKRMEEREKQVEEFYKSDSEDDEHAEEMEKSLNTSEIPETMEKTLNTSEIPEIIEKQDETQPEMNTENIELEKNTEEESQEDIVLNVVNDTPLETTEMTNMEVENICDTLEKDSPGTSKFTLSDYENEDDSPKKVESCNNSTDVNLVQEDLLNEDAIENQVPAKKSALELLKEQLGNTQPKLSGAPNYVIDLDDGTTHLDEVSKLIQRFSKHISKKSVHKKPSAVELDILCVSQGGEIHKEKVAMQVEDHDAPQIEEKPGLKYKQLKTDLQAQMALRRNEQWKEKQAKLQAEKEANEEYDVYKGEKDKCGIDDILDDEEEEFSNAGSDADEDDLEENDEVEENTGALIDNEASEDGEGEDEDEEIDEDTKQMPKPKKMIKQLRRIVQPVDSDSDDENDCNKSVNQSKQMDSTVSWADDDDFISAGQTNSCRTPNKQLCMQTKSELGFLSPVCRLTGLQSFDATGNFLQNSPGSPAIKLGEPSPFKQSSSAWSKSLFNESPGNTQNLEDICSGTFATQPLSAKCAETTDTVVKESDTVVNTGGETENVPNTQDMIDICSGNFEFSQTEGLVTKQDNTQNIVKHSETIAVESDINIDEVANDEINIPAVTNDVEEAGIDDDDHRLISQLVDEDELESFKKKFESPLQGAYSAPHADERIATKIAFDAMNQADNDDSSEEDDLQLNTQKRRKKNTLIDSDDEDQDIQDNDENIDLQDEIDDINEEGEDKVDKDGTELGYDSEENEILVEKAPKPKKMRMKDFLENEAELSESEWGSEDEDERNLDVMELEEGDKEEFDEEQLKDDLEKIHMKQVLDEDKKKLKVLQELYLDEDEELKGAGRQRQFRWRNIDNVDNEDSSNQEDAITQHDDEGENEEEWRKKRYERELFLQSQKQNGDDDDTSIPLKGPSSQLIKFGQRAVIKNKQTVKSAGQFTKKTFTFNTQRGSFLSRKDEVLTRVAEYTKVSDVVMGAPKNSRNFVFKSVTKDVSEPSTSFEDKKRKAGDSGTPVQLKRLRLNGFSPADQKKKAETRSKARLFSHKQW